MDINFICIGNRMPPWVQAGYSEYAKRIPAECGLKLIEIAPGKRGKNADVARAIKDEGLRMEKAIPKDCRVIALDVEGRQWSTEKLSVELSQWMAEGRDIALLVGGPEGLAETCLRRADQRWSLSALTMPHPLVRVVVAEQLYRAWSILRNHPYHRAG